MPSAAPHLTTKPTQTHRSEPNKRERESIKDTFIHIPKTRLHTQTHKENPTSNQNTSDYFYVRFTSLSIYVFYVWGRHIEKKGKTHLEGESLDPTPSRGRKGTVEDERGAKEASKQAKRRHSKKERRENTKSEIEPISINTQANTIRQYDKVMLHPHIKKKTKITTNK